MLPKATFALGSTAFDFKKEIPIMAKFVVENSLLGYDKKWVSSVRSRFLCKRHKRLTVVCSPDSSSTFKLGSTRHLTPRREP